MGMKAELSEARWALTDAQARESAIRQIVSDHGHLWPVWHSVVLLRF